MGLPTEPSRALRNVDDVGPTVGASFWIGVPNLGNALYGISKSSSVGPEAKIVFANRWLVFLRLVNVDIPIFFPPSDNPETLVNLEFIDIGGGVTF